jgi:outer membrane protein assembly factor BamB
MIGSAAVLAPLRLQAQGAAPAVAPAVSMIAETGEAATIWPRWRGPSGQGIVAGTGDVDRWSATQNVRWKTPLPGAGNSSPIVWRDRIFLTTAYDNGGRVSMLAFDRGTGKQLWEAFAPGDSSARAHAKNGYASATPSTDGERVYVSLGSRGLLAVDMNGKVAWHQTVGPIQN